MRSIVFRAVIGTLGLLGLLGSTSLSVVAAPVNSPDYAAIDSYVSNSLAGTPGFALSIVHGDQVTHMKGFGIANSAGVPMTADTPLVIGSQAKSSTTVSWCASSGERFGIKAMATATRLVATVASATSPAAGISHRFRRPSIRAERDRAAAKARNGRSAMAPRICCQTIISW